MRLDFSPPEHLKIAHAAKKVSCHGHFPTLFRKLPFWEQKSWLYVLSLEHCKVMISKDDFNLRFSDCPALPEVQVLMARSPELTQVKPQNDQDILSASGSGVWVVNLPPNLRAYQEELETLLCKVFAEKQFRQENLDLAQQMSLNWCLWKCREVGISFEES
jgi:hypothetical protein